MKITKLGSATVIIESNGISILCDPWLIDGIYYGSWCNFPPIPVKDLNFDNIDYIYLSHIHPDHFDPKTMALLSKDIPVLIHRYHRNFLKVNIERLGFKTIELENGKPYKLSDEVEMFIFAADDCDPAVCGHMFSCITNELQGSLQLDSLCVVKDNEHVLVNANDCPYRIAENTLKRVKMLFPEIDFALVGYTSASLYPHCLMDYTEKEMKAGISKAIKHGFDTGLNTLKALRPAFYMPFAGTYILGGFEYKKNKNLPLPEIQDAVKYFQNEEVIKEAGCRPILLTFNASFDIGTSEQTKEYVPVDVKERAQYIEGVASKFKYTFESELFPSNQELLSLFEIATGRLKRKQQEIGFFEDVNIVFDVNDNKFISLNLSNAKPVVLSTMDGLQNYQRFKLDTRLLEMALKGPRFASWNNIEIGALLSFARKPDIYRIDIHTLLNSLHV